MSQSAISWDWQYPDAATASAEEDTDAVAQDSTGAKLNSADSILQETEMENPDRIGMTQWQTPGDTTYYFTPPGEHHPSSRAFYKLLQEAAALHARKQRDYGTDVDPFANVRASEDFGIPGWLGCAVRMNDKIRRIMAFAKKGELANESIEDAFLDLLVYAGIAAVLYREEQQ